MYMPLYSTKLLVRQHKYSFILVTILKISAVRAGPLKQNQRLASRPQADAVVKSLCKGGSWARKKLIVNILPDGHSDPTRRKIFSRSRTVSSRAGRPLRSVRN